MASKHATKNAAVNVPRDSLLAIFRSLSGQPVRTRIAVPDRGLGERLNRMQEWLDQNAGADGWALTPSGVRGVVNDALAIPFRGRDDRERFPGSVVQRAKG